MVGVAKQGRHILPTPTNNQLLIDTAMVEGLGCYQTVLMKCKYELAQQRLLYQHIQLATTVSGRTHLQSLGERHSQEAGPLCPHRLFLRLDNGV
jgi:hypothetical protein